MTHANPYAELSVKNEKYIKACTELYMAKRNITYLANFERFVNIEILWINDNKVECLENLDNCIRIKELYCQNNQLRSLQGSLKNFKFIRVLCLSNNNLTDLQLALRVLSKFVHLQQLDLYDNPLSEEEGYRLHIIAAIPSVLLLDRHVVTDSERSLAKRLQRGRGPKSSVACGAPPLNMSSTVKLLLKEIERIEREDEKRETRERHAQFELSQNVRTAPMDRVRPEHADSKNIAEQRHSSLNEWEIAELKAHLKRSQKTQNYITSASLSEVLCHMQNFGKKFQIATDQHVYDDSELLAFIKENFPGPAPRENLIYWPNFIKTCINGSTVGEGSQNVKYQWVALPATEVSERALEMFETARSLQRRALALSDHDPRKTDLVKEAHLLSNTACRLESSIINAASSSRQEKKGDTPLPPRSDFICISKSSWLPPIGTNNLQEDHHPSAGLYKTNTREYKNLSRKKRSVKITKEMHSIR